MTDEQLLQMAEVAAKTGTIFEALATVRDKYEARIAELEAANAAQRDNLAQLVNRTHEQAEAIRELEARICALMTNE